MVKVKNKKRNLAESTAKKRDQSKKKSMNAFEVHINREKHKVLGRKNKTDRGLPGVARSKAINKRKNTLLHEYKVRDKNNTFLDKRIGEKNSAMTHEDRVMARFAAERIKAHKKKNIFNLNDEEILTHGGRTLADIEKFDDPRSDDDDYSDDDNKTGKLEKDFVSEAHFGGGILSKSESSMSRKDLIEQLIAESKKRKAEKQKIREQTLDLTDKLDTDWKDLLPIVKASKKSGDDENLTKEKVDDYDIALRELRFEARGTPSDRLKSEEEIAKEEKEKLEKLEADRMARMKGFDADFKAKAKHKSADDLDDGDGFFVEDIGEETLAYGKDGAAIGAAGNAENDDDEERNIEDEDEDENENEMEEEGEEEKEEESKNAETPEKEPAEKFDTFGKASADSEAEIKFSKPLTRVKKSLDPYDNIPVLKISDDNEVSSRKIDVKRMTVAGSASSMNKNTTSKSDNKNKSRISVDSQEAEIESEVESDEEGEDSDEEDNLSDLKNADSSSEEEEEKEEKKKEENEEEKKSSLKKTVNFSIDSNNKLATELSRRPILNKSILKSREQESSKEEIISVEERMERIKKDLLKRKEIMEKAREELPYTFAAPRSLEELRDLLDNRNADYQSVIVERIIKCNHQSLGENNKEKLDNLFAYLLQHINIYAVNNAEKDVLNCFQIFDRLCPHLYDLAHVNPVNAKKCIQEMMREKHEIFELRKKKYPGLDTLIIFKLVSLLFPTSDYRHPIVTPALVFMSQILTRCRVKNKSDISKGLFICTLVLEYTLMSKRFSPSVINFLRGVIHMGTPKPSVQIIKTIPPFKSVGELSNLLILDEDQTNIKVNPRSNIMLATDLVDDEMDDDFRVRAFVTAVNLLDEFKNQLEELEAAQAIFEPVIRLINIDKMINYPENLKTHVKNILNGFNELADKKLEYITREKKKPKALRLYEPRIETVYDGKKHRPMSKEKAEREKLLHKYKREFKGAIREVRRDRSFLAKVQIKQQIKGDEERKRKVKEIFGDAAFQQGELNKIKRSK